MQRKSLFVCVFLPFLLLVSLPVFAHAKVDQRINARSAILIDMDDSSVLLEQNADYPIPPASITKILSLYLVFEAIKEGQVQLSDKVEISSRAASTGGSRMGLKARTRVPLEELIKGMAVVSGNDACVAAAEHISGSVELFVKKMNAKARELGMTNSRFMTPNGLPAAGQVTTARDIAKLSMAYLRRFPESLTIHSMQGYTYGRSTHHNANRLLGKCPGVDGLKTGFVCASGYNISATAKRGGVRILAVVMGARSAWVRCSEAERLIEAGFRECGAPHNEVKCALNTDTVEPAPKKMKKGGTKVARSSSGRSKTTVSRKLSTAEKREAASRASSVHKGKAKAKYASVKSSAGGSEVKNKSTGSGTKTGRNRHAVSAKSGKADARTASKKKHSGSKTAPQAQAAKKKVKS